MKRRGDYEGAIAMRFGRGVEVWPKTNDTRRVWIQAVSLGEMLVIESLLKQLAALDRVEILLTTTTSTGYKLALEKYSDICDKICYFPLDFWPFSRRVWRLIRPDLAICAETELWPEHIQQAENAKTPIVLVNGRLSDRSFWYARRLAFLVRRHINKVSRILAISEEDGRRFAEIGVDRAKIAVMGNLKVDVSIGRILDSQEREKMKLALGLGDGFILLGSSTWPGEEEALLEAFKRLREKLPHSRLLLVPRHAERRGEIRSLLERKADGFTWRLKSESETSDPVDILVADTSGELRILTQLADLAFIGKSLPPHKEGQTPIECGLLGVPMVFGPGMSNFRSIRDGMLHHGAAIQVQNADALSAKLIELSLDKTSREAMVENQKRWSDSSKGALERTLKAIEKLL